MIDMEVCQDGIEGVLPSWCVEMDLGWETWVQLALELGLLLVLFSISYAYFRWRRKKQIEKEMLEKIEEEQKHKAHIDSRLKD